MKIFSINNLIFGLIFIISIFLRFICINKVDGLWYDELVIFNQISQSNLKDVFLFSLLDDVHLPLYQIFLYLWAKIFSYSDFSLRSFSAVCGIFTVILGFFVGKSLKNTMTGFFIMALFAVNSFLIYYSQEVRMYELLALFATFNILSLAKIYKNNSSKIWFVCWIISSTGLNLTYTISILYIAIQIILLFLLRKKEFIIPSMILFFVNLPVVIYLIIFREKFANFITGFYSDWSSLFVVFQNIFTPKLVGLGTNPPHYIADFITHFTYVDFIVVILPLFIAIYCVIQALNKSEFAKFLAIMSILFLGVEILAFVLTDFKILSRYLIMILPNLLVIMGLSIDKNKLIKIFILIFILINFSYLCFSSNSAFRQTRVGFLPLVKLLEQAQIEDNDIVIVWNRKEVLFKYLDKKVFVFSILKDFAYKSEFILNSGQKLTSADEKGKKEILRGYFKSEIIPMNTLYLTQNIIYNMKNKQKIMITAFDYFDNFEQQKFIDIVNNDEDYNKISYNNLITLKSLLDLRFICDKNLKYIGTKKLGSFVVYVYEK